MKNEIDKSFSENRKPQRKRGKRSEAAIIKRKWKYIEKQVGPLRKENKMLVSDLQQKNFELAETRKRLLDCQIATKKTASRVSFSMQYWNVFIRKLWLFVNN